MKRLFYLNRAALLTLFTLCLRHCSRWIMRRVVKAFDFKWSLNKRKLLSSNKLFEAFLEIISYSYLDRWQKNKVSFIQSFLLFTSSPLIWWTAHDILIWNQRIVSGSSEKVDFLVTFLILMNTSARVSACGRELSDVQCLISKGTHSNSS